MRKIYTILLIIFIGTALFGQQISFSPKRGFYSNPVTIALATNADLAGAVIRYTTDSTLPTPTNGTIYSTPITITTTTTINAIAFNSTDTTEVKSHSYLYLADVINQPNTVAGFPTSGFEFDPSITTNPSYNVLLDSALRQIPTMILTLPLDSFIEVHNDSIAHIASIEVIDENGTSGEQETGELKRAGSASFNSPKRTFRLNFKSEFGASKFEHPLMGANAADEFDQIQLRPAFYNSINGSGSSGSNDIYDQFVRDLQECLQVDNVTIHGAFVHLYINGIYWGVYNATERGTDNFAKKYFDGDKDNWDAIKGGTASSGNDTAWNNLNTFANTQDLSIAANYDSIQKLVDVEQFIEYVLLTNFAPHGNHDPIGDNSFATRHRKREEGFRFWIWNTEEPPNSANVFDTGAGPFDNIYNALLNNSDFKMQLADQIECECYDSGNLTPNLTIDKYQTLYDKVSYAYIAEAARWADATAYTNFESNASSITGSFLPNRTTALINNYQNAGLLPSLSGVQYSLLPGLYTVGTSLSLSNTNGIGTIYYTLDGSDPRLPGGGLNPNALIFSGNISIDGIYNIKARVFDGTNWSGACAKQYFVPQDYTNLVINEIHYHPVDSTVVGTEVISSSDLEFIEIFNNGSTPIDMTNVRISDGGNYTFEPNFIIQDSAYIVIAKDIVRFELFYNCIPTGDFSGSLSNSGEDVVLKDPFGNIIDSVRYDDKAPWQEAPDGDGPSIALIDADSDNNNPFNWNVQKFLYTPKLKNNFCDLGVVCDVVNNVTSCGGSNGIVFCQGQLGNTGGAGYQFLWNTGGTNPALVGVSAGIYIITVEDLDNCTASDTVVLNDPVDLAAVLTIDSLTLDATLTASGGQAPYTYLWSDGSTTQTVSNLPTGYNSVEISDYNGCSNFEYFYIPVKECEVSDVVIDPVDAGMYQVSDFILSDGKINIKDTEFKAGTYIELLNNFEASPNFNFLAEINPCN